MEIYFVMIYKCVSDKNMVNLIQNILGRKSIADTIMWYVFCELEV